ncbi:hypothetical protein [Sinomicrobium pectinilyticum]|uniref:hypothetical protein n=1 Tax=Sinomicrobium pectinilyticum TaxID=1084421 RepID=UPI0011CD85E4|nr:hypothetical protein [Sinomicrobium pectinilyticum]
MDIKVNPPYFFLMDGIMPFIYRGNTTDWEAKFYINNVYFNSALPLSDSSFALIGINSLKSDIYKLTHGQNQIEKFPELLEAQGGDGIFSTDGTLYYDQKTQQLVFLYYYRNQFICTDTNLQLKYRGTTIDTISRAKIKVDKISSENSLTMSAPALKVNNRASIYNNLLFNNSNLLAANEDSDRFEKASVIDAYDLSEGDYRYSFYIPLHEEKKIKAFKVVEDHILLALYDHDLVRYHLHPSLDKPSTKKIDDQIAERLTYMPEHNNKFFYKTITNNSSKTQKYPDVSHGG